MQVKEAVTIAFHSNIQNSKERIYTGCKGNKCHPFNSRRGRFKGPIYIYIYIYFIWGLNLIVLSEKGVSCSVLFTSYCYIVRNNAKKFTSVGRNIIFKNILRVRCSLRKIKLHFTLILRSETRGNVVKYALGSLWLRKPKVEVLTIQRTRRRSMLSFVRSFKLK